MSARIPAEVVVVALALVTLFASVSHVLPLSLRLAFAWCSLTFAVFVAFAGGERR